MRQDKLYKLYDSLTSEIKVVKKYSEDANIPEYVLSNLKHSLFDWQKSAIEYFIYYLQDCQKEPRDNFQPTHLLFNMATGSGKTLVMAACILYLYKQGYRHFIFTANYKNIVNKTQDNFINTSHPKYLFANPVVIDNQQIAIKEVSQFSNSPSGIEIKFTNIQLLHNEIHIERENVNTLADLNDKQIVILADEAHNFNAQTKTSQTSLLTKERNILESKLPTKASSGDIERKGWEHTLITLILNKNNAKSFNDNICLEFTATVPDKNQLVSDKYTDKLIYKFDLKDFLRQGYTKEVILISSYLNKTQRILLALVFNWYRHRIALKYKIANFKPVILFRSKDIEQSKADYQEFVDLVNSLKPKDFEFLQRIKQQISDKQGLTMFAIARDRISQVIHYLLESDENMLDLITFIKGNFKENNLIITNSKNNKTKSEKTDANQDTLLNSLENSDNRIRGIFTVKRLTEGWDVLNLFDIVRLFQTRDEGKDLQTGGRKIGQSTIEERQLIGRGVRYCPFDYGDHEAGKRKFDGNLNHDLRILEEFCFHSIGSRYISELKNALIEDGYINDNKKKQRFELKPSFKQSALYQDAKIAFNEREDNHNYKSDILTTIKKTDYSITWRLEPEGIAVIVVSSTDPQKAKAEEITAKKTTTSLTCRLSDYLNPHKHVFLKAVNILAQDASSVYSFTNLQQKLAVQSVDDLLLDDFLGDFKIYISNYPINQSFRDLDNQVKLDIALGSLKKLEQLISGAYAPQRGGEFKLTSLGDSRFREFAKEKMVDEGKVSSMAEERDWYVLDHFVGTDQELAFLKFMDKKIGALQKKYQNVFLIRNEEVYKIYDFDRGRGFQPDFLLFLVQKNQKCCYQIFIEPKGEQFKDGSGESWRGGKEGWKEDFLKEIQKRYQGGIRNTPEDIKYKVIGLGFYNRKSEQDFAAEFDKILLA